MERKIGEIFEFGGEWYQCLKSARCYECVFKDKNCDNIRNLRGYCIAPCRSDRTDVHFKKLEKVGEPYYSNYFGKFYQKYITYIPAVGNNFKIRVEPVEHVGRNEIFIEIKQNKEDMEEKKNNYDGYMDKECIPICDALNSISDVHTTGSCCGHCKNRFMVFFTCDNPHSLAIIARVFDRRYIGTSQPWYIELHTKDRGSYYYFIHSETKYSSEEVMMKDVNQIIENIGYWCDDKFASHFKGCDNKPTLAPFDINLAKAGNPVCTRDGRKARIICFDAKDTQPIIGLYEKNIDGIVREYLCSYHTDGRMYDDQDTGYDLMMLLEKKEGWINIYKGGLLDTKSFSSKEEAASKASQTDYIDTIKIEWEE